MSRISDQQVTALVILGAIALFFFVFVLGIYGGIKYLGAFGDLTGNPPRDHSIDATSKPEDN
jgi:hypothetical protein